MDKQEDGTIKLGEDGRYYLGFASAEERDRALESMRQLANRGADPQVQQQ